MADKVKGGIWLKHTWTWQQSFEHQSDTITLCFSYNKSILVELFFKGTKRMVNEKQHNAQVLKSQEVPIIPNI
jgi:hypothetical protein